MKKIFTLLLFCKGLLPFPVLNWLRQIYSPSIGWGGVERLKKRIATTWQREALVPEGRVVTGPFQGMKYIQESVCSALPPKILGTYEKELHAIVEAIVSRCPSCIIDIGAAEGFYAVGFAMRLPTCRVIAFEADSYGQQLLHQLASINGVTNRIAMEGYCNLETLGNCLTAQSNNCVIVCDAEGAEFELLDPVRIPMLARFPILVELHPWDHPDIKATISSRFATSSLITMVASRPRVAADFPIKTVRHLSVQQKLDCMNEVRPPGMEWLWIEPKSGKSTKAAESPSMEPSESMRAT